MVISVGKRAGLLLAFWLSVSTSLFAQTPPSPDETIKINTNLVVLDAQVLRKKNGGSIGALRREDFVLLEDGIRQEIALFNQDKLPLSILLLLDLSASVKPVIEEIRKGALQTLEHLKPEDEVAVMTFADRTELLQTFTRDRRVIIERIGQMLERARVGVGTELHKALYTAAPAMNSAENPLSRRVVIVVTDNIATMYKFTNPTVEEVAERLLEHNSVVCGLVIGGGTPKVLNIFNRPHKDDYNRRVRIDEFAEPTGGEVMSASALDVNQKLAEMIAHLRIRYSIGYSPTNPTLDGKFRRVSLKVSDEVERREGPLVIKTRQGYFARQREKKQ